MNEHNGGSNPPFFITRSLVWFPDLLQRENFESYLQKRDYPNKEAWDDLVEKIKAKITTEKPENIYFDSKTIFPVRSWRHKKECPVVIKKRQNTTIVINNDIFPRLIPIKKNVVKELTVNGRKHFVDIILDNFNKGKFKVEEETFYQINSPYSLDYYLSLLKQDKLITIESLLTHFPMSEKVEIETFLRLSDLIMSNDFNLKKACVSMLGNICPKQNSIEMFVFLNQYSNFFPNDNIASKYLREYFSMERWSNRDSKLNSIYQKVKYNFSITRDKHKETYISIVNSMYDTYRKDRNKGR